MKFFPRARLIIIVLVSVIFILGFLLRAQETISHNFLFLLDQGRDMMAVKSIVYDHHATLIGPYTSLQGIFQGPLWYYFLSIPTFIAGGDPWGTVFLMLVISMILLVLCFFIMRRLFGTSAALVTTFLLAVSPEAISAATYTWNPHPMWLLIFLYIMSFYKLVLGNKRYHLIVWPIISLMFHFQAALGFFILAATASYLLVFQRKLFKTKNFFYGFSFFLILFTPHIIFELRHNFLMTKSFLSLFGGSQQGLFTKGEESPYINIIKGHFDTFRINYQFVFQKIDFFPSLSFLILILSLFLLIYGKKNKIFKDKEYKFVLLNVQLIVIIFVLTCFYPFPLRYWFLTGFQMFYILPIGLILSIYLKDRIAKVLAGVFVILMLFQTLPKTYAMYTKPDYGGTAKVKGKSDSVNFIYEDAKENKFGLLVFTPPVNTDAFDYLIFLRSRKSNNYIPHKEKKGIFYLLIEPDRGQEWTYKGWLETVVKTGRTVWTKELPSGLIVEKRVE